MKKILILLLIINTYWGFGQTANTYTFSATTSTYSYLTGSTAINAIEVDEAISASIPIGFTFNYCGTNFTDVKVSSNGWLTFTMSASLSEYTNDLDHTSYTAQNRLAPLWDDIDGTTANGGIASYLVSGTAPNRTFTVEWRGWQWNYSALSAVISFQVILREGTNVIDFAYKREATGVSSASASIGIQDAAGNYLSLNGAGASPTANSSTETTNISAKPANNQIYRWTPPVLTPMAYVSSTTTQSVTSSVGVNSSSNQIIGLQVVTSGSTSPLSATSFTFNTTGTTAPATDITNAKLWSTGTSSTFATTTQVGSVVAAPNGTFSFAGAVTLSTGTNYFWLTYDIPSGAVVANVVDAQCTSVTVGSARTPSTTAPAGNRPIVLLYCTPAPSSVDGTGITNVTIGTINNTSGAEVGNYGNYSALSTNVTQGATQSVNITFSTGYTYYCKIWIDWNNDGDFNDAGEEVYSGESLSTNPTTLAASFAVPGTASLGSHRLRIGGADSSTPIPCYTGTYGSYEDYSINVLAGTPMSYVSSTSTQSTTSSVYQNTTNNEIIGLQVVTSGTSSPLSATSFTFNTTGTTAPATDITNAKLWSTGTSSTFATTTQVGSVVAAPNGTFSFAGAVTLSTGTNYFWLTYDIPSGAVVANVVDAQCTSVTVGSARTPSTTAPAGNRPIAASVFDGTFENAPTAIGNGFTTVNGANNYWIIGTATDNGGTQSAYITNDGTSNTYNTATTTYSHIYFDQLIPAGESIINLLFDWKANGEGSYDWLEVFAASTSVTPVAGSAVSSTYHEGDTRYNLVTTWQSEQITLDPALAGTTVRIIFQWKNDASDGTQAPAAIDNVSLVSSVPGPPECAINLTPVNGTTDLCGINTSLTWAANPLGDAPSGYYGYLGTDNPPTNLANGIDLGNVTSVDPGNLNPNETYYWKIVPYNVSGSASSCTVYSFSTGSSPVNNEPCNAEYIVMGSTASGDLTCSDDANEPALPACWDAGIRNTLWYRFIAPPSGSVDIITHEGTLETTQIALYSGACGALSSVNCNDDQPSCGSNSYSTSQLAVSGLTVGASYFVVIDGENASVGTFTITIADHSAGLPIVFGQDCGFDNVIPVCNNTFTVGDPGFQAVGNYCDFPGTHTDDCTSGERGSVWYHIQIGADGILDFTIIPNDWDGTNETDYDFLLYKMTGAGAVTCADIASGAAGPIRCDFSFLGVTGLYSTTDETAPPAYSSYGSAFEPQLDVLAGEEYFLVVQNYSNSTAGFSIDLGTSPLTVPGGVPASLTWTGGGNSTSWYNPLNWGDCAYYPNENIDANIVAASAYQPVIATTDPNNGNPARVKTLSISPGAKLTINAGQTFELYGDYDNTGILDANTTSNFTVRGAATQNATGSLQSLSAFGNLIVNKTANSFILGSDMETKGTVSTSNATSILNTTNRYLSIGGNLTLSAVATLSNVASGTVEFNGSAAQTLTPNGTLTLHNVVINNTGAGLTINSELHINNTGVLTFTNGVINTGTNRVRVNNTSGNGIAGGNTNSYLIGNLRQYIANNSALYRLPIGDANRYALIQLQNHNLVSTSYLDAKYYNSFTNTGSLDPSRAIDFGTPYLAVNTEGMWEIIPDAQPTSGTYDIALTFDDGAGYDGLGLPLGNAFNGLVDNQFGVLKRSHTSNLASDWYGQSIGSLNANNGVGRILASGSATRYGISSFSDFALGTIDAPLPIELTGIHMACIDQNEQMSWVVASETNLNYYLIEKSSDAQHFEFAASVDAQKDEQFPKRYEWIDHNTNRTQITYYRLTEIDLDGKSQTFKMLTSQCASSVNLGIVARSNEQKSIWIDSHLNNGIYQIFVYDDLGRQIFTEWVEINESHQLFKLNKTPFEPALYLIKLQNAENTFACKVLVE